MIARWWMTSCGKLGVRHEFVETHEMDNPAYRRECPGPLLFLQG